MIGVLTATGLGTATDLPDAVAWLDKAARQGFPEAKIVLDGLCDAIPPACAALPLTTR